MLKFQCVLYKRNTCVKVVILGHARYTKYIDIIYIKKFKSSLNLTLFNNCSNESWLY